MFSKNLIDFQEWLGKRAHRYCLTKPWAMTISPLDVATLFAQLIALTEEKNSHSRKILPGYKVTLFDYQDNEEITYLLVAPEDSNPVQGRLSFLSPLGSALIGQELGRLIKVNVFSRTVTFKIIGIKADK